MNSKKTEKVPTSIARL